MKRYALAATAAALLLAAAAAATVHAQNNRRVLRPQGAASFRGMLRPGTLLAGLDLTEQQREQARNIIAGHKEEIQTLARESVEAQRAFRKALASGADPAGLKPDYDRISEARWSMLLLRHRIASEIRQILTPEQQERLDRRIRRIVGNLSGRLQNRR